jgi:hypothetical protein
MIRFALSCDNGHDFEAWFSRSGDFDAQKARGLVSCPHCGSQDVDKALMAPAVTTQRPRRGLPASPGEASEAPRPADVGNEPQPLAPHSEERGKLEQIRALVKAVRANAEDVGSRFPEEARRIHYGESQARGIFGKADADDVRALTEEGIAIAPLPVLPDDKN